MYISRRNWIEFPLASWHFCSYLIPIYYVWFCKFALFLSWFFFFRYQHVFIVSRKPLGSVHSEFSTQGIKEPWQEWGVKYYQAGVMNRLSWSPGDDLNKEWDINRYIRSISIQHWPNITKWLVDYASFMFLEAEKYLTLQMYF